MKKILTGLLFLLPVVFFVVCYFLISATEEDIAQGAGTPPDVWNDLWAAFRNNARLSDMYAWAVINFFDYQYSFGVDTIFRLLDVAAAIGMLVLMTSVVLGKRPRWNLKDALVFAGCFLIIFLTPFGYTYYRGFSMAHNYLIISLALIGFSLPFLRKLAGQEIPKGYRKWYLAVLMGLVFGLSANFPPLAFLASYVVIKIVQWWQLRRRKEDLSALRPEAWEWWMIGGMLCSMVIGYTLGPGVSGYASDPVYVVSYDYVTVAEVFSNFGGSVVRIVKHLVANFGRTLLPAILILGFGWCVAWGRAKLMKLKLEFLPESRGVRRMLIGILVFCMFCTLAGSQIIMPIRLCLPAYLGLTIVMVILFRHWWQQVKVGDRAMGWIGGVLVVMMLTVIGLRGFFAWDFHGRVGETFRAIRESEEDNLCIDLDKSVQRFKTPFNIFQQEETFVARRESFNLIYGKEVWYCAK